MSELFKSAFEYFSGPANGQNDNPFVGQIIEISNVKLRIKRVIAEGGFAVVFAAQDVATGKEYALKVIFFAAAPFAVINIECAPVFNYCIIYFLNILLYSNHMD
nr:unnamed protein product [Callosobruchus analis]